MIQLDQGFIACFFDDLLWLAPRTGKVKQILGVIGFLGGPDPGLSCEHGITRCFPLVQSRSDPSLATMFFQFIREKKTQKGHSN